MGYKIVNTLLANQDLDGIVSYIADDLENPAAAANFLDELDECLGRLEKMPLMYEQCQDVRLKGLGYRKARVGNYLNDLSRGRKCQVRLYPTIFSMLGGITKN